VGNEAIKEIGAASDRRIPEKVFSRMVGRHFANRDPFQECVPIQPELISR
jgi:hypothetical protein